MYGYDKFVSAQQLENGPYCLVNDDGVRTTAIFAVDGTKHEELWLYQPTERKGYVHILGKETYRQLILSQGLIGQPPVETHEYSWQEIPEKTFFRFPWIAPDYGVTRMSYEKLLDAVNAQTWGEWTAETRHALSLMGVCLDYSQQLETLKEYGPRGISELLERNNNPLPMVEPTASDVSQFIDQHGKHSIPRMWYAASPLDVPEHDKLHIHEDGTVHIAFIHVIDWVRWRIRSYYSSVQTAIVSRGWPDERVQEIVTRANAVITASKPAKKQEYNTPGVDIEDLDKIWELMPPCIDRMLHKRQFPIDSQRTRIVPIMKQGGLSVDTVGTFLQSLNDQDELRKRFDHEHNYRYNNTVSCDEMREYCPYVATETTANPRRAQCHQKFIADNPTLAVDVERDAIAFGNRYKGGPHHLIAWKLRESEQK